MDVEQRACSPGPNRARAAVRTALAALAGCLLGSIPTLLFWFILRGPEGRFPSSSEILVLGATPLLAGMGFAAVCPGPVWRRSVAFTAGYSLLPALLVILVLYKAAGESLGPAPLGVLTAWILSWFAGGLGAGLVSRVRSSVARGGTPRTWTRDWWHRRRCSHNWELIETRRLLGRVGHLRIAGAVGYHNIYYYRCRNCGATKTQNDRWGPAGDRSI